MQIEDAVFLGQWSVQCVLTSGRLSQRDTGTPHIGYRCKK